MTGNFARKKTTRPAAAQGVATTGRVYRAHTMSTIARERRKVYLLRVAGPGNYFREVEGCALCDVEAAALRANDLATWLTVDEYDCRSREVPASARRLRRDLVAEGIDPWKCAVQVVVLDPGHPDAVHGYRAERFVKVATDHRRLLAGA